jgi:oligopeptide transport system ATP-binding protein
MSKYDHTSVDYNQKVLEIKDLKKYFFVGTGINKLTVPAVDGVTFDVYKREVFGLVGESGCGKTTTGRTIIKLYTPTEGSIDIYGVTISAGFKGHQLEIKRIKDEMKQAIDSLDASKAQKIAIEKEYEQKIYLLKTDIRRLRLEKKNAVKEVQKHVEEIKEYMYQQKMELEKTIENSKNAFERAKGELHKQTLNQAEVEYRSELKILKFNYKKKLEGLKDSAALKKDEIERRIGLHQEWYATIQKKLETTYTPLIEEGSKDLLALDIYKAEIEKLRAKMKQEIEASRAKYKANSQNFVIPDKASIKKEVVEAKAKKDTEILNKKAEVTKLKEELKSKLASIPASSSTADNADKIAAIKEKAEKEIEEKKELIQNIKSLNRSKEALENSRKMQMIFQDPISSLNPRMTVREIVGEGMIINGSYSDEEITAKVKEVLDLVGLSPDYITRYPHEFSGGQRQRIGIARALIMDPTMIIADEPISALDVSIRAQVINLLTKLKDELGLTILFIAHDLSVVRFFCDRIAVMYNGKIVEIAESEELFNHPIHPYTVSLLSAIPQPDPDYEKGRQRTSYNPMMHDYRINKPELREVAPGHQVLANEEEFKKYKEIYMTQDKTPKPKKLQAERSA